MPSSEITSSAKNDGTVSALCGPPFRDRHEAPSAMDGACAGQGPGVAGYDFLPERKGPPLAGAATTPDTMATTRGRSKKTVRFSISPRTKEVPDFADFSFDIDAQPDARVPRAVAFDRVSGQVVQGAPHLRSNALNGPYVSGETG